MSRVLGVFFSVALVAVLFFGAIWWLEGLASAQLVAQVGLETAKGVLVWCVAQVTQLAREHR
jgi:hypothetical protein